MFCFRATDSPVRRGLMPVDLPIVLADRDAAKPGADARADRLSWVEVALSVLLTTAAVLLVSFLSVVTNL
jgi:hypothetical protein